MSDVGRKVCEPRRLAPGAFMVTAVALCEPEYIVLDLVRIDTALNLELSFCMDVEETLLAVKCY